MSRLSRIYEDLKCCIEDELDVMPSRALIAAFEDHLLALYEVMPDSCTAFDLDPRGYRHKHHTYRFHCDNPRGAIAQIIRAITNEIGQREVIIVWRTRLTLEDGGAMCRLSITQR